MFKRARASHRVPMTGISIPLFAEETRAEKQQSYCADEEECQDVKNDSFRIHNVMSWNEGAG